MRLPLSAYLIATTVALTAAGSAAQASPSLGGLGGIVAPPTAVSDVAYREVCNPWGFSCRRVWVDDYRGRGGYNDGYRSRGGYNGGYSARDAEIRRQQAADAAQLRQIAAERQRALAIKESFARGRPVVVQGARTRNDMPERQGGQER